MPNAWIDLHPGSSREDDFLKVFGRLKDIPVTGWLPQLANLPTFDKPQEVWVLDTSKITSEERERLVMHIAERFQLKYSYVDAELERVGTPILASECSFHTTDPLPLIMADDLEDPRLVRSDEDQEDYEYGDEEDEDEENWPDDYDHPYRQDLDVYNEFDEYEGDDVVDESPEPKTTDPAGKDVPF